MSVFKEEARFDMVFFCFKKCVNSFKEKPLGPYEKECMFPCLENQANMHIELHNNQLEYERFRSMKSLDLQSLSKQNSSNN